MNACPCANRNLSGGLERFLSPIVPPALREPSETRYPGDDERRVFAGRAREAPKIDIRVYTVHHGVEMRPGKIGWEVALGNAYATLCADGETTAKQRHYP